MNQSRRRIQTMENQTHRHPKKHGQMSEGVRVRLTLLREDFASVNGRPFDHFYCPILFRDEDAPLCKGHVLNQAFGVGFSKWTVQREDVDNFFGSRFESGFTNLRYRNALQTEDVLGDPQLRRKLRPKVYAGNREVEYFIPAGEIPRGTTPIQSAEAGLPPLIGLKISPEELGNLLEADWHIGLSLDLRASALVSLIKAAHLTMFSLFGYRYALSTTGYLVGRQILGKLFETARGLSRQQTEELAKQQLSGYVNMVRPLLDNSLGLVGTILDEKVMVGWSASGFPWTIIVLVPTGDTLHGVMLPVGDHQEAVATWDSFMKNENSEIRVKVGFFDSESDGGVWSLSRPTWQIQWPKGATLAGDSPPWESD